MSFRWPGSTLPTVESLRASLELHDRIINALEQDLARAEQVHAAYQTERAALEEALAAAKGTYVISTVFDGGGVSCWSATAPRPVLRAVERAYEALRVHDDRHQRWLQAEPTTMLDSSPGLTRECHPDTIRARIDRTRTARGQLEHQLADALARQLSEREQAERQVASMPEAAGVRSELAKLRSRLGLG